MEIVEVTTKYDLKQFIRLQHLIYANDPFYSPQLEVDLREHFSVKNPFFMHSEVKYFLAKEKGIYTGRIASIINYRHIQFHQEKTGFFGFFESINDSSVSSLLLERVCYELKSKGMTKIRGPMNFSTNEECGFLIDGFDEPPMIMTPYNPKYYIDLMDMFGMKKSKDLYGYIREIPENLPEKILRVAAIAEKRGITARKIIKERFTKEMQAFKEVYNSAWENNWGFIPLTDEELAYMSKKLKHIIVPELMMIAEDQGKPVGFMGLLPDYNYVLRRMSGKLNPVTLLKALYYSRKIKDLRLLLLGIRKEYRNRGVDALLFRECFKNVKKGGYKRAEFSWILEDNIQIQRIIDMAEGKLYKKYRIYEREL